MLDIKKYLINECDGIVAEGRPDEISIDCPECDKGNHHFSFNASKEKGACFKCNYAVGSSVKLIQKIEGITREKANTFYRTGGKQQGSRVNTAIKVLRKKDVVGKKMRRLDTHKNSDLPVDYVSMIDGKRDRPIQIPKMFHDRHYSYGTIEKLGIGFCSKGN